jgi:hypothetical protein
MSDGKLVVDDEKIADVLNTYYRCPQYILWKSIHKRGHLYPQIKMEASQGEVEINAVPVPKPTDVVYLRLCISQGCGARAGAETFGRSRYTEVSAPGPGQTKVVYLIIIHIK